MVKVGFICEGKTETNLLSADRFGSFLSEIGIERINVINAETSGNLLPHNIIPYIASLTNEGASVIVILTDLDEQACIAITRDRIKPRPQDILVVAVKEIEAWFLANTNAMRVLFGSPDFIFEHPEKENEPFRVINQLLVQYTGRGIGNNSKRIGGKIRLVNRLINNGINVEESAEHPNCPSARYFIEKLKAIGKAR